VTSYMFRLTEIKIDETRSNYWDGLGFTGHDTDTATLAVQVGDQLFPPVSKFLGDLAKDNTYPVGLAVGPVEVNPGDDIVVSYLVVNHGYPLSSEATGLTFVNFLSDAAAAVCTALYGAGAAWQELNTGTKALNAVFFADCDGLCAGDKYVLKGADLAGLGPQQRAYPGFPSPSGCGASSKYEVSWEAQEVPAGYSQGVLLDRPGTTTVVGYYGPGDQFEHVIAAGNEGIITEVYWNAQHPVHSDVLLEWPGVLAVTGYFAPTDGYQHVVVATRNGALIEHWFAGGGGKSGTDELAQLPGLMAVAGYYCARDKFQHIIAATADGNLHDVYFPGGGPAPVQSVRGHYDGIVGIGAYYCPKDNYDHAIVAQANGDITELWFGGPDAGGSDVLGNIPGVSALSAYWSAGDGHQHVIAAAADGALHEIWFTGLGGGRGKNIRGRLPGITALAGFYSAGDNYEHVIAATGDGALHELFRTP
jgi:hypothetical protein